MTPSLAVAVEGGRPGGGGSRPSGGFSGGSARGGAQNLSSRDGSNRNFNSGSISSKAPGNINRPGQGSFSGQKPTLSANRPNGSSFQGKHPNRVTCKTS
ncbi:MAG: hypothetical protein R3C11_18410 [Planctomycetaceae bacterium]